MKYEGKTSEENKAGQNTREEAYTLQSGIKKDMGGEEVTEEMIRAGLEVYSYWHPDFDSSTSLVREVYLRMQEAKLSRQGFQK